MIYQSILDEEMDRYITFDRDDNNWMNSKMGLDAKGVEFVEQKKQANFDRISSNARGWITTLIAVAAFILSVISLTKQSGT